MNALYVLYHVYLPVETKSIRMKRVGFSPSLLVSLKANAIFTQMSRMKVYTSLLETIRGGFLFLHKHVKNKK
jgi:hypothetical protein